MNGKEILVVVLGYLFGSIPFAYLAGRLTGVDVRNLGGVGTTTVMREVNPLLSLAVLVLDMAKGLLPVLLAHWLHLPLFFGFVAGITAVLGHCWPLFLGFSGGGGIATALGALLGLAPREFAISFAVIVAAVLLTSNVRFSAILGFIALPVLVWLFHGSLEIIIYTLCLPLSILVINIPRFRREVRSGDWRKGLIIDREFTPWQTHRRKADRERR